MKTLKQIYEHSFLIIGTIILVTAIVFIITGCSKTDTPAPGFNWDGTWVSSCNTYVFNKGKYTNSTGGIVGDSGTVTAGVDTFLKHDVLIFNSIKNSQILRFWYEIRSDTLRIVACNGNWANYIRQ